MPAASGVSAVMTPDAVATPLPPRKPCQTGKQCPTNAASPASDGDRHRRRSGRIAEGPAQHDDRREALARSRGGRSTIAHLRPSRRPAFVAPRFPLPTVLRSTPAIFFARIHANETEPRRYERVATAIVCQAFIRGGPGGPRECTSGSQPGSRYSGPMAAPDLQRRPPSRRLPPRPPRSRRWILGGVLAIVAIALPTVLLLARRHEPLPTREEPAERLRPRPRARERRRARPGGAHGVRGGLRPALRAPQGGNARSTSSSRTGAGSSTRRASSSIISGRASRARSDRNRADGGGVLPLVPRGREAGSRVARDGGAQARDEVQLEERELRGRRLFAQPRSESEGDSMTVKPIDQGARPCLTVADAARRVSRSRSLRHGSVGQRRAWPRARRRRRTPERDVDRMITSLKPTERARRERRFAAPLAGDAGLHGARVPARRASARGYRGLEQAGEDAARRMGRGRASAPDARVRRGAPGCRERSQHAPARDRAHDRVGAHFEQAREGVPLQYNWRLVGKNERVEETVVDQIMRRYLALREGKPLPLEEEMILPGREPGSG